MPFKGLVFMLYTNISKVLERNLPSNPKKKTFVCNPLLKCIVDNFEIYQTICLWKRREGLVELNFKFLTEP